MKKIIGYVAIIVVIVVALVFGIKSKDTSAIRLGFIAPLSGDAATYGETEKNATELAVKEINSAGGINGRLLEVVYEDGRCSGKDALSAMQKLMTVGKINIVLGGACSAETLAIAPLAEQNKVLLFSAFSSNPAITNAGDYVFRNSPSDSDVAKLDANTIASKYKSAAIITENTDYSQGVRTIMKNILKEKGVNVVSDEVYNSGNEDFRSIITKVKTSNPEVIYINPGSDPKAGGLMVKQIRELGMTTALSGNLNLAGKDSIAAGGKFMEGVVSDDVTGLSNKGLALLRNYQNTYGKDPSLNFEMGAAYDRVYIVAQAIKTAGTDSTKIKNYLYTMPDFAGTLGSYHFDQNGDVVGIGFMNVVLHNGQKVPYTN